MNQAIIKESSPFTPGKPVPREFFEGREQEFSRAVQIIKKTASGNPENIYVSGERGIGKSSFTNLVKIYAEEKEKFLTAYASLGGISELEDMIEKVFSCLVQDNRDRSFFGNLKQMFKEHIKEVGIGQLSIQLDFSEKDKKAMLNGFLPLLSRIFEDLKDRKGILIVLDDINGLAKNPKFANYLKSLVDENAVSRKPLPFSLIICSLPERKEELILAQESVARIFHPLSLNKMGDEEVEKFYRRIFKSVNYQCDDKALGVMNLFSGGLPMLMQEIGEAVYYHDSDMHIDIEDADNGIMKAAQIVGEKYLQPKVLKAIRSSTYHSILAKLSKGEGLHYIFSREEMRKEFTASEKKVFDNFLRKMKSLGVIVQNEKTGTYRFATLLYPIYIGMQAKYKLPLGWNEV